MELLGQISKQLASFSPGANFVNSTFQPPTSNSPFQPDVRDVRINTLWVISLTLSLLAAFMTITAQQWIRRVPLPREMSVRDAVRLRQFRHDGLVAWHVPTVIAFLPVVVQISVILFLVGLLLFLQEINDTVATIFAIITGTIVSLFTIASLCPLVWSQCPYKAPLLPTLWTVLQWCAFPIVVVVTGTICILSMLVLTLFVAIWNAVISYGIFGSRGEKSTQRFHSAFTSVFDKTVGELYHYVRKLFSRGLPYETDRFWTVREKRAVRRHTATIDISAFCWAAVGVPARSVHSVIDCLYDIPVRRRVEAGLCWAALEMGCNFSDFNLWFCLQHPTYNGIDRLMKQNPATHEVLSRAFAPPPDSDSDAYTWTNDEKRVKPESDIAVMLTPGSTSDNGDAHGGSALALLFHGAFHQGENAQRAYKRLLMGVRRRQDVQGMLNMHWRWPTIFLYLYGQEGGQYDAEGKLNSSFSWLWPYPDGVYEIDISQLFAWAQEVRERAIELATSSGYVTTRSMCAVDCILASTATALHALAAHEQAQPNSFRDELRTFLLGFDEDFWDAFTPNVQALAFHSEANGMGVPTFVGHKALINIGQDLKKLFGSKTPRKDEEPTQQNEEAPQQDEEATQQQEHALTAAVAVVRMLKDVCEGYYEPLSVVKLFDEFLEDVQNRGHVVIQGNKSEPEGEPDGSTQ